MQTKRRQILKHLRDHDRASVETLADLVDLAPVTVRHHINVLLEEGSIRFETERVGRGRPRHVYSLTPKGCDSVAPDNAPSYELLTSRLLDAMRDGDRGATEKFFVDMAHDLTSEKRASVALQPIEVRLDTVTTALAELGFEMRWERDGEDYLIRELACPFGNISSDHHEICAMDQEMIERFVDGDVRREQWRVEGDAQCVYRVSPRRGSD